MRTCLSESIGESPSPLPSSPAPVMTKLVHGFEFGFGVGKRVLKRGRSAQRRDRKSEVFHQRNRVLTGLVRILRGVCQS